MNWKRNTEWLGNNRSLSGLNIHEIAGDERFPNTVQNISHNLKALSPSKKFVPNKNSKCGISYRELIAFPTECSMHRRATP